MQRPTLEFSIPLVCEYIPSKKVHPICNNPFGFRERDPFFMRTKQKEKNIADKYRYASDIKFC